MNTRRYVVSMKCRIRTISSREVNKGFGSKFRENYGIQQQIFKTKQHRTKRCEYRYRQNGCVFFSEMKAAKGYLLFLENYLENYPIISFHLNYIFSTYSVINELYTAWVILLENIFTNICPPPHTHTLIHCEYF